MKWLRFSIRGLLVLTVSVAAACYWWDKPSRVAREFAAAIESGDPRRIRALAPTQRGFHEAFHPGPNAAVTLKLEPFSFQTWIRRRRYAELDIVRGERIYGIHFTVTATEIDIMWTTR